MAASVEDWMCVELDKLGLPASEDNAKYILSIETAEDLEEYMHELLGDSNPKVLAFIKELLVRWRATVTVSDDTQVYRKSTDDDIYFGGRGGAAGKQKTSDRSNKHSISKNVINGNSKHPKESLQDNTPLANVVDMKKKTKFVPLYSQEGQEKSVLQIPGRHSCECQAAKHKLINNCLQCGRVVCDQEGSGPCFHCGNLEEHEIISRGSRKSEQLRQRLMKDVGDKPLPFQNSRTSAGLDKAIQHKDKLLNYDKTSVQRTKVIDDESDYFSTDSNQWLSKKQREALRKRNEELRSERFASRRDMKVTLDFAGRRVLEAENESGKRMYDIDDTVVQEVHYGARAKNDGFKMEEKDFSDLVNPLINVQSPQFVSSVTNDQKSTNKVWPEEMKKKAGLRLQDRELQEMSDEGMCMSMHQPWASLLVCGIKMHEGRTWYTAHRGRLWIAATAKVPTPEETADIEQTYRYLLKDPRLEFPSHYPVGCLLGCVDVMDCLAQDQYREKFPDGESASPYVFICQEPQQLVVKFPIKGKHKIYKLDSHIHQAAKKGLR
ncbi:activating signal cointegrator 1-like isoform X2 [Mizuhopecten yessoensis]|uniref:activating signal cointegrator 1-like isoform X2 n=1 Tax=Mizuhopecten yessoensis TaxID=6573 RepID=UPI000B457FA9|nr:activating signal cointegrator 1-like isoform X2 [Mizuhopecten yessoensis]